MDFKTFVKVCQDSLPKWYNEDVHRRVCELTFGLGKLHACKFLCDYSSKMETRELYGLKWAKEEVVDLIAGNVRLVSLRTLIEVNDFIKGFKESPAWNMVLKSLNDANISYNDWSDIEILIWSMEVVGRSLNVVLPKLKDKFAEKRDLMFKMNQPKLQ